MTNRYSPLPPPSGETYSYQELLELSRVLGESQEHLNMQELHVEPAKPREGMVAVADGSDWDPSDGQGPYIYIGGAWVPMFGIGGGPGVTDHGALTGLADDDHTHYLNTARHAAIDAADHASGAATDGYVLTADGSGGAAWEVAPVSGNTLITTFVPMLIWPLQ